MTPPFGVSPSRIAVTGMDNAHPLSYYVLNPIDTKVYVLGGNGYGQLGIGTTAHTTTWSVLQRPANDGDLTGIIDINADDQTDHYPTAGVIVNGYDDGSAGAPYDDVFMLWGRDSSSALGSGGDKSLPTVPDGFTLGTSRATRIEMGGHTTMYYDPDFNDTVHGVVGKMCYLGHKINGSMGDGTPDDDAITSFDCIHTPAVLSLCAAEKPPIIIIPSRAIFTTPLRSENIPPIAVIIIGVEKISVNVIIEYIISITYLLVNVLILS